jgi:DNA repair exonuclease SbcCD ATPase subunit
MDNDTRDTLRQEIEGLRADGARRQQLSLHACRRLFFDFGIRPSVATVRDLTQTGSASDIPKDIDAFWNTVRTASRVRIEGGSIPEPLVDLAGELLSQLFSEAQEHARAALTTQAAHAQAIVDASEKRLHDTEIRHGAIDEARERAEARVEAGSARIAALEAELAAIRAQESHALAGVRATIERLEKENAALSRHLEQEQATAARLHERIDTLQSELRHNTEHYAEQIKDAIKDAERRVKPMLVELDSLRSMASTYRAGVRDASQKEFEFIQQLSATKARADRLETQVRDQSDEIDALARERDVLMARAGLSAEVGSMICALAMQGRLSREEMSALGTQVDAYVAAPSRCPACGDGEPELSRHENEFELSCPDCEHSSGPVASKLAALDAFCRTASLVRPA